MYRLHQPVHHPQHEPLELAPALSVLAGHVLSDLHVAPPVPGEAPGPAQHLLPVLLRLEGDAEWRPAAHLALGGDEPGEAGHVHLSSDAEALPDKYSQLDDLEL